MSLFQGIVQFVDVKDPIQTRPFVVLPHLLYGSLETQTHIYPAGPPASADGYIVKASRPTHLQRSNLNVVESDKLELLLHKAYARNRCNRVITLDGYDEGGSQTAYGQMLLFKKAVPLDKLQIQVPPAMRDETFGAFLISILSGVVELEDTPLPNSAIPRFHPSQSISGPFTVVHGDLKPANLLYDFFHTSIIKIGDLGSAEIVPIHGIEGALRSYTAGFAAPECTVRMPSTSVRCDTFSATMTALSALQSWMPPTAEDIAHLSSDNTKGLLNYLLNADHQNRLDPKTALQWAHKLFGMTLEEADKIVRKILHPAAQNFMYWSTAQPSGFPLYVRRPNAETVEQVQKNKIRMEEDLKAFLEKRTNRATEQSGIDIDIEGGNETTMESSSKKRKLEAISGQSGEQSATHQRNLTMLLQGVAEADSEFITALARAFGKKVLEDESLTLYIKERDVREHAIVETLVAHAVGLNPFESTLYQTDGYTIPKSVDVMVQFAQRLDTLDCLRKVQVCLGRPANGNG